jgi:hypothetical protein
VAAVGEAAIAVAVVVAAANTNISANAKRRRLWACVFSFFSRVEL